MAYEIGRTRWSLKIKKVIIEKIIPKKSMKIPGSPRYFKGCLIIIISTKEAKTPPACKIGFFVEVFLPVSYRTVTFSSEIFTPFWEASIKISASAVNPTWLKLIMLTRR